MAERPILVIGAGPAGMAAACRLAESGRDVILCDRADRPGGAIYRRTGGASAGIRLSAGHEKRWQQLKRRQRGLADRMDVRYGTTFVGLDGDGFAALKDASTGIVDGIAPAGLICATGAVETVKPVPGWQHAGVMTAGALQVGMKTGGTLPQGDAILAGNGPLLVAVAAQMTALGRPPLMIVEAGRPLLPRLQAAGLPFAYIREALSYLWTLKRAGIPWLHNAAIRRIEVIDDRLAAWIATKGSESRYEADFIALHDGLRPNSIGLPAENIDSGEGLPVVHAGDCRQTLGARAAVTSGHDAADRLLTALGDRSGAEPSGSRLVRRHMRAQRVLAAMFRPSSGHPLRELPDDTVLCRCENKTFGDLRALPGFPSVSAHQLRLNGRIGMGRCQGRFCAAWALQLVSESGGELQNETELTGRRWPVSPVSIGSLAGATLPDIDKSARSETQSD